MAALTMGTTFGSVLIGLVASAVIYGLTVLQTYIYYRRFPNDSWKIKTLVFVLWVLDTLHLILCTRSIYWYLVTNFNHPDALQKNVWSLNLQTDCNGLIGMIVELFFARRVWKMSRNFILTGVIVALALLHFGLGVFFTVEAFILDRFQNYFKLIWVTSVGLGGAAAADIIIAASLCYLLSRNKTGFEKTDSLISTLMVYAINTGLLTSICATAAVIAFAILPEGFVWLSFFWVLGKFYVNSLMAALNSRQGLREKAFSNQGTSFQLSPVRENFSGTQTFLSHRTSYTKGLKRVPALAVNVETIRERITDYEEPASPYSLSPHPYAPTVLDRVYDPESATSEKSPWRRST